MMPSDQPSLVPSDAPSMVPSDMPIESPSPTTVSTSSDSEPQENDDNSDQQNSRTGSPRLVLIAALTVLGILSGGAATYQLKKTRGDAGAE